MQPQNIGLPHMVQKLGLATGVSWDNYDGDTETLSGAGTLHDTVGISYQNLDPTEIYNRPEENLSERMPAKQKSRKRSFQPDDFTLEPNRKKPKFTKFDLIIKTHEVPCNLARVKNLDTL